MKRLLLILIILSLAVPAAADNYTYVSPKTLKTWIQDGKAVNIVDIQVKEEFSAHHLPGSLATHAYPVKTDSEKAQMDSAVTRVQQNQAPVVIVCPRGKGGAERGYNYMAEKGVAKGRLLILEAGMAGWPYADLVEKE